MSQPRELALGFDLSTQKLKVVAVDVSNLETFHEKSLTFETDLKHFKTTKGVHIHGDEVYSPVEMWIEALDVILGKMEEEKFPFERVQVISGAGQQHASVFWSKSAERLLGNMEPREVMHKQLSPKAFSHPYSPNWQDHSTTRECQIIEEKVGGPERLAEMTGSKAHHRFTGPQILKFRRTNATAYKETSRISLASSFLTSLFLGKVAPIDISDVCGMNLWDIPQQRWSDQLLGIVGCDSKDLRLKLGEVADGGAHLGPIASYFVKRYGFNKDCLVIPFTGDNPATITSLPLSPMDCIVSLGTSTTLLLTTNNYKTSPAYHIFNHPTTKGLYFAMLCYKNGSLAREQVRNDLNKTKSNDWQTLNSSLADTSVLGGEDAKLGFYFPLPEIIPDAPSGTWRFKVDSAGKPENAGSAAWTATDDARAIVESQALSMRLRAQPLLSDGKPRHLYFVGGASQNSSIVSVMSQVLGSQEGVYRLTEGVTAGACARGSAIKAAWAQCGNGQNFEDFVRERWSMEGRLDRLGGEESQSVWERYGSVLDAYSQCEDIILSGTK